MMYKPISQYDRESIAIYLESLIDGTDAEQPKIEVERLERLRNLILARRD